MTFSAITERWYGHLPEVAQQLDQAATENAQQPIGQPLLCWMEGIGSQLQALNTIGRDSGSTPGFSALLNLPDCPAADLSWLAQFVGLRFSPDHLAAGEAVLRAIIGAEDAFGACGNWSRGTVAAIQVAALPYLIPPGVLTIVERTTDPYHLTISVPLASLAGVSFAEVAAGGAYGLPANPTYTQVLATFATYSDWPQNQTAITAAITNAVPAGLKATISFE
jgi:hypothetical protein